MSKRNFSITRNEGELYEAKVTDSYGKKYKNWFEHAYEANDWIYYIWENEEFHQQDSMKMLEDAIYGCTKLDEELGLLKGNRDNLD